MYQFQNGDRIVYTGKLKDACSWLKPNQREGTFSHCTSTVQNSNRVGYAHFDNTSSDPIAFYIGDIELLPDEPVIEEDWS